VGAAGAESLAALGKTGESIGTRRIVSDLEIFRWRTNPHIAKYAKCGAPGPSPGLALVKLDFLIGTKWGSNTGRK